MVYVWHANFVLNTRCYSARTFTEESASFQLRRKPWKQGVCDGRGTRVSARRTTYDLDDSYVHVTSYLDLGRTQAEIIHGAAKSCWSWS